VKTAERFRAADNRSRAAVTPAVRAALTHRPRSAATSACSARSAAAAARSRPPATPFRAAPGARITSV